MGRSPCCDKLGLKKGPWTPEEDQKLLAYIEEHDHGNWRSLPANAGLQRCGKSCRLRWTNYLRPDIKRGKFSLQEEETIIQLHALLGNRWSNIATHLPKRTDNEIKNYWNTHLKKRLAKMGIDPATHKPKNDALVSVDGQTKNEANLSHMSQWESARLEAEARLVRESKLRSHSFQKQLGNYGLMGSSSSTIASSAASANPLLSKSDTTLMPSRSLDVLKAWSGSWLKSTEVNGNNAIADFESPTSTLTFSENAAPIGGLVESTNAMIEFVGSTSCSSDQAGIVKEEAGEQDWKSYTNSTHLPKYREGLKHSMSFTSSLHDMTMSLEGTWTSESLRTNGGNTNLGTLMADEGFTHLLLNNSDEQSVSDGGGGESDNGGDVGSDYYEDNKNYWNIILSLVNSSPSDSPMF